jgi:hypothetical protein
MGQAVNSRWRCLRAAMAAVLLLAGCGGSTGPTAGALKVNLVTPYADDGGILLTISGGPIDSVECLANRLYTYRVDANSLRVIIAGEIRAGTVALIRVPDTREASQYSAVVSQAAARPPYGQRDPALYTVTLVP